MCLTILHQCQWGWGISFSLFVQRKTECFGNYHNKNIRYSYSHHLFSALILSSCARFILVLGISYKVYNGCERRNAGVFNNVYWNKFEQLRSYYASFDLFHSFFFFGGEMRLSCFKDPEPLIYLLLFLSLVQWTICYSYCTALGQALCDPGDLLPLILPAQFKITSISISMGENYPVRKVFIWEPRHSLPQ